MKFKSYNISESDSDVILDHDFETLTPITQIAYRNHIPLYTKILGSLSMRAKTGPLPNIWTVTA